MKCLILFSRKNMKNVISFLSVESRSMAIVKIIAPSKTLFCSQSF